jgi:hypothetical protein
MDNEIVKHVLILKLSTEMSSDLFHEVISSFRNLSNTIENILSFEYGMNNSPEGLDQGMTHVITLTFANTKARDAYLIHPDHVKFATWLGSLNIVESLIVVDYIPKP